MKGLLAHHCGPRDVRFMAAGVRGPCGSYLGIALLMYGSSRGEGLRGLQDGGGRGLPHAVVVRSMPRWLFSIP